MLYAKFPVPIGVIKKNNEDDSSILKFNSHFKTATEKCKKILFQTPHTPYKMILYFHVWNFIHYIFACWKWYYSKYVSRIKLQVVKLGVVNQELPENPRRSRTLPANLYFFHMRITLLKKIYNTIHKHTHYFLIR